MTTELDLTKEIDPSPFIGGEVDTAEHSRMSRAKKVIIGPLSPAAHATEDRSVDPININVASTQLGRNKAYRIISDGSFRYRQTNDTAVPASTDIYVPANTAVIISTRVWGFIGVAGATGTFVQAIEVQ